MEKKAGIAFVVVIAIIMVFFAGCGGPSGLYKTAAISGSPASGRSTDDAAKVPGGGRLTTVEVWSHNRHEKEMWENWISDYNNTTGKKDGIRIDYTTFGDDYQTILTLAYSSGQGPDIHTCWWADALIKDGDLVPIEDMPGGTDFLKHYEGMLKPIAHIVDGKTYGVPYYVTSFKLVYNKDMFKRDGIVDANGEAMPPVTWAEVVDDADKLTKAGGGREFGIGFPMKYGDFFNLEVLYPFFSSIGHEYFDVKTGKYDFSDFRPAFDDYLLKIRKDRSYFPGPETLDNDPARALFSEGKIGMLMSASWDVGVFTDQFPARIQWGVSDIPVLDPEKRYKEPVRKSVLMWISKFAKRNDPNKVMEVYKWFLDDQKLADLYSNAKYIPYDERVIKLAKTAPAIPGFKEFATGNSYMKAPEPTALLKLEGLDFPAVMMQIWMGRVSPADGLADLDLRYNAALSAANEKGILKIYNYTDPNFDISIR